MNATHKGTSISDDVPFGVHDESRLFGDILGTALALRWNCVAGSFCNRQESYDMASIEYRGSSFRIIFRHGGEKFSRSLKTDNINLPTHRVPDWKTIFVVWNKV